MFGVSARSRPMLRVETVVLVVVAWLIASLEWKAVGKRAAARMPALAL